MPDQTELVYYQDARCTEITARITQIEKDDVGLWLLTDRTLFFPGGGGQLPDHGSIGGIALQDIRKQNEQVWHRLDRFKGQTGDQVSMQLDWQRRYYMMQQHSGQHLISHVLYTHQINTVSVHLGEEYTLIECESPPLSADFLQQIEQQANALIRRHLDFHFHWADRNSIAQFPLRRPAGNWLKLRVVEIDGIEYSACAGTHVSNTAEIGLIKFDNLQHIRGHARLRFFIGKAAYQYLDNLHTQIQSLKPILQSEINQVAERAQMITENLEQQRKSGAFYRRTALDHIAREMSRIKTPFIFKRLNEFGPDDVSLIARTLANQYQKTVFLITGDRFYFICSQNGPKDLREFIREQTNTFQIRGGGSADFVQGQISVSDDQQLEQTLIEFIGI